MTQPHYDQKSLQALLEVNKIVGSPIIEGMKNLPPELLGPERDTDASFVITITTASPNVLEESAELKSSIESDTGWPVIPIPLAAGVGGGFVETATNIAVYVATDLGEEAKKAIFGAAVVAMGNYLRQQIKKLKKKKDEPVIKYKEIPFYDSKGKVERMIRVRDDEITDE